MWGGKPAWQSFCFSQAHPPSKTPHTLETKPVNSFYPLRRASNAGAPYLRLNICSLLGSTGQCAGTQALSSLLDLLQVPFYVRELRDTFCLSCKLLCLLEKLSKAFSIHLCYRFHSRCTDTFGQREKILAQLQFLYLQGHRQTSKSGSSRTGYISAHPPQALNTKQVFKWLESFVLQDYVLKADLWTCQKWDADAI